MDDSITVSDGLASLIDSALQLVSTILGKSSDEPFLPFVVASENENRELILLDEVDADDIQQAGLRAIGERGCDRAVLCYDGYLSLEGEKRDVAYLIGCERGDETANIFAIPYLEKATPRPLTLAASLVATASLTTL